MEIRQQEVHIIVCEGSSEVAYLQELNRLLREKEIPLVYIHKSCDGGQYSKVVRTYKKAKKESSKHNSYLR